MSQSSTVATPAVSAFGECAGVVRALHAALQNLQRRSAAAQVPSLQGREWFELIERKLIPQLTDDAFLVVAVVGGTNIGKSVVFNHIAGCRASATSPLASGTKHPTLLVRGDFVDTHNLAEIFPGFELHPWTQAEDALEEDAVHRLYWRVSGSTPENLLVLDTPDVDSDARINWDRADQIRQCADVLIAVLTQQKYNDAAVKEFFRKAAQEDKAVVIVFNQCQLPEDEEYWPLWVGTFCRETGIDPEVVYVAPGDRKAAEENRLPFFERDWPVDDAAPRPASARSDEPRDLLEDLSRLKFAEVKFRTLQGSLRELLDHNRGLPAYLKEVELRSAEFRGAAELLAAHELAEIDNWPPVPNHLLVAEIREWWASQREGWSATVHGFYNALGKGLAWPYKTARNAIKGEPESPFEAYRAREWNAILDAIEKVFRKLTWMAELGNDLLRPRLQQIISGTNRLTLLETIQQRHREVDFQQELADLVARQLAQFRDESPRHYEFFKRIDSVAAAARPATSVVLFVSGFGPLGDALAPVVANSALAGVLHVAGDVAGGTMAAAVGETVISEGASQSAGYLEAKFRKMHAAFTARRAAWLAGLLKEHVLGTLPEDLAESAVLPSSEPFQEVQKLQRELRTLLRAAVTR